MAGCCLKLPAFLVQSANRVIVTVSEFSTTMFRRSAEFPSIEQRCQSLARYVVTILETDTDFSASAFRGEGTLSLPLAVQNLDPASYPTRSGTQGNVKRCKQADLLGKIVRNFVCKTTDSPHNYTFDRGGVSATSV